VRDVRGCFRNWRRGCSRRRCASGCFSGRTRRSASVTEALLAALQADPTRRRRTIAAAAIVGLAALGVMLWFAAEHRREVQQIAACAAEGASIGEVWNDEAQTRLRAGLLAALTGLAEVALAERRLAEAVPLAERAVVLRGTGVEAAKLAESRFVLAQALSAAPPGQGRDRGRATALVTQAREALREVPGKARKLAQVEAFLARR